jgi:hypothetical protein
MILTRIILSLCGIALAALIVYAIRCGDFWQAGAWLTRDPWGRTSLADLYLGLIISAVVIALFERPIPALFWIIPLPFLGNVWTVAWFVYRLPALAKNLKPGKFRATV